MIERQHQKKMNKASGDRTADDLVEQVAIDIFDEFQMTHIMERIFPAPFELGAVLRSTCT